MKRLIFSEDIFHTLAQMEDKEAGQMAKAIACYAHDGTLPKWSNTILMALFSLFKKQIDIQTDLEERRRIVNKENAKGRNRQKSKAAKTTPPPSKTAKDSEPTIILCEESKPQPTVAECTPFERMAAIPRWTPLNPFARNRGSCGSHLAKRKDWKPLAMSAS